ncbi:hypothetical protein KY290_017097 [Solanum tuberosum]|uniref:Uncharacterized protein n=1 Tax=Solanum tuberosum TaxID=4113 RepID=A0ABQ7VAC2_SOLTU|nr:hypothetical protein KY285_016153 [Solanum tuberosum]KAH0761024.1 hypothetical protein KY290_017097 [Solanum tuberosum]
MGQWSSQFGLAKWLGDSPNGSAIRQMGSARNPAHWLLLEWLSVTFGSLGFIGRCAECPPCSSNG